MYIKEVHDYSCDDKHLERLRPFLDQGQVDSLKKVIDGLVRDEFDRMEEYASDYISDIAADRAESFLEKVIAGDKDAAIALLGNGGRYADAGCKRGKPWAKMIHGNLSETSEIKIRRKIVEAHPDLIASERIKDLESIVDGLSRQVNELEERLLG